MVRHGDSMAPDVENELLLTLKALANPTRLCILGWLKDPRTHFPPQDYPPEEVGVCLKHIQNKAGISQSSASQFMTILQRAGLVTSRRLGQWTHYKRDEARITEFAERFRATL